MNFVQGVLLWGAGDPVGALYTVSGLPFQPKALRFRTFGHQEGEVGTEAVFGRRSVGVATGPSERRCVAASDQDGAKAVACASGFRDDCVAMTLIDQWGTLFSGRLDLAAILADGFQLVVDATSQQINIGVMWEAWGGAEFAAHVLDLPEPPVVGSVTYGVPGFTADGAGQALLLAGAQQAVLNTEGRADSGFCVGYATAPGEQVAVAGNSANGAHTSETDGYARAGECLAMIAQGGGNPDARARLAEWLDGGFRLEWLARAVTGRRSIALAMKGGSWRAGTYVISGDVLGAQASVSLPFQAVGLDLVGRREAESAAGSSSAPDRLSMGVVEAAGPRQASGYLAEDAVRGDQVDIAHVFNRALIYPSPVGAYEADQDVALGAAGFIAQVARAGGVSNELVGYLAFG